jgi:hypothetical protein
MQTRPLARVSAAVPEAQLLALRRIAAAEDRTVSQVVRRVLGVYLQGQRERSEQDA